LKEDTIPKPDGLAMVTKSDDIELNSNNIGQCSKMIEGCPHCVRGSRNLLEWPSRASTFQHDDDLPSPAAHAKLSVPTANVARKQQRRLAWKMR
jgi:hypothetical protein